MSQRPPETAAAHQYLDQHRELVLDGLLEFVRIPSVSTQPEHRPDIDAAAGWVADRLRGAGPFSVEILPTAGHPVVFAEWAGAPGRPTLLVYGHYDVQAPEPLEAWTSPPFQPEVRDGRLYARGVSDDKGPMLIPIEAARAFFATGGALPVNLKMLFEGEEEVGSPSLEAWVSANRERLRADYALSADGAMWRIERPSVNVGGRGLAALNLTVRGAAKDLHSGRHGGAVPNAVHALVGMLAALHTPDGRVAVPGFYEQVRDPTEAELAEIEELRWDDATYQVEVGARALVGEPGYGTLARLWLRPTLEINGVGGGYQGVGGKTVVPAVAHAKLSCRLVPDQDPAHVIGEVRRFLEAVAPPGVTVDFEAREGQARAYRVPLDHPGLGVARRVLGAEGGQPVASVLMGGTLPVSEIFARLLGIDTVTFSFSTADEDFHAPNEFFRLSRLGQGLHAWVDFWAAVGAGVG